MTYIMSYVTCLNNTY